MSGFTNNKDKKHLSEQKDKAASKQDTAVGSYSFFSRLCARYDAARIFCNHFSVHGIKRLLSEVLDEGVTIGLVLLAVVTIIGIPILDLTKKDDWTEPDNFALTITDRYGNFIGSRGIFQGQSVSVDEMPDYFIKATLATEDRRFFDHWGIDFWGLGRALATNVRANGVVQGGSTLTQQLAKNLFLSNERTLQRKIKEVYLALWLEMNYSKKEILQLYLDHAYMGGGAFGAAAAAQFYFGKDIRNITLSEAAMLAGLFKAPSKFAPHINLPAARARANVVLNNLVESDFMSESEIVSARRHPATAVTTKRQDDNPDYFLDWILSEVRSLSDKFPERTLTVRTTYDYGIQAAAEEAIVYHLRQFGTQYNVSQAAAVVLDNDGSVRAIVGGRDYGESHFNRATQGGRPAGSSFKPYVYGVLLERGLTPNSMVVDAPINWGKWSPANYGRSYAGEVDLTTALARSINTIPVRLTREYLKGDTQPIVDFVHAMGINADISHHKTMVLGISNMTPLDQATGYNVFANGGMAGNRHGITEIVSSKGRIVWNWTRDAPPLRRVISATAAANLNYMLSQVLVRGSGRRAALPNTVAAGKTGTSQRNRDAWFVGFTGNYTTAVWMGNDDYSSMSPKMTGGVIPAMVWQRIMLYAQQNAEPKPLFGVNQPPASSSNPADKLLSAGTFSSEFPQIPRPPVLKVIRNINETLEKMPEFALPSSPDNLASSSTFNIR